MTDKKLQAICALDQLTPGAGMAALIDGYQIALFYLPEENPCLYAIDNHDPIGKANVLSRGIVGDVNGELVVASPLYKQHFSLNTGKCLEADVAVTVWPVLLDGDQVLLETDRIQQKRYA